MSKRKMVARSEKLQGIFQHIASERDLGSIEKKIKETYGSSQIDDIDIFEMMDTIFELNLAKIEYQGPLYDQLKTLTRSRLTFRNLRESLIRSKSNISKYTLCLNDVQQSKYNGNQLLDQENEDEDHKISFANLWNQLIGKKHDQQIGRGKIKSSDRQYRLPKSKLDNIKEEEEAQLSAMLTAERRNVEILKTGLRQLKEDIKKEAKKTHPELKNWIEKFIISKIFCMIVLKERFNVVPHDTMVKCVKESQMLFKESNLKVYKLKEKMLMTVWEGIERTKAYDNLLTHKKAKGRPNQMEMRFGDNNYY